ncbi:hypothetical protein DL96DRAFT_1712612 [Flagelloscypha sp. PMI_526]|nr:hypothetical protein DL96DRAFT_1712612 [Flagelloscypha sp. PMI_526]
MSRSVPFVFEDRTAVNADTDLDDLYDRLFFKVARMTAPSPTTTTIYEMRHRASRHRDRIEFSGLPTVNLQFAPDENLGVVTFLRTNVSFEMARYLRKTSMWGSSLSRKFTGSDGHEYKWSWRTVQGHEWTCTSQDNRLVAHYNLKTPQERAYDRSGNSLTIYENYQHLIIELLASFTIMRHIALYSL